MWRSRFLSGFLLLTALATLRVPWPLNRTGEQAEGRLVRLHASRFAFSPATLRVEVRERITVELTSEDVVHGLFIDEYGIQLQADPGQVARATFVADRPGTFRMRCSVTCGPLHPFMLGRLEVGEPARPLRAVAASLLALAAGLLPTSGRIRRES